MKTTRRTLLIMAAGFIAAFACWTAAVTLIDVQPIGPEGTSVGFALLNSFIHGLMGVHLSLYIITDWLSIIPVGFVAGFALLGLLQWITRKSLRQVDRSLLILGGFYAVLMTAYLLFETVVVNYRPVLIDGVLEASYPSSTTMLVLCVMPTALMQLNARMRSDVGRRWAGITISAYTAFMIIGRFVSGVHWFTDIVGGALLSAGLVLLYRTLSGLENR